MATVTTLTSTHSEPLRLDSSPPQPRDVKTTLNFHKDNEDGSPPAPTYVDKPQTYERPYETHDVTIHDIRGKEHEFSIYKQGFQVYPHVSKEKDFLDTEQIKAVYYPETEQLLKDATGATRIFIFDHTIRRAGPDANTSDERAKSDEPRRGPVQRAHIDQTASAARSRVPHHLPDEAERLSKTRFQIINVWRPIKTIRKDPLTLADSNTVKDEDLVTIPLIYPNRAGETHALRHKEGQKWYYKSELTPEEVILIKCFDSEDGLRTPHSAFVDPSTVDAEPRESIEVRALVFHEH
jgi:hypothetical protein